MAVPLELTPWLSDGHSSDWSCQSVRAFSDLFPQTLTRKTRNPANNSLRRKKMQDLSVLLLISLEIWQPETPTHKKKGKIKSYLKYCGRLALEHWPAPRWDRGEGELQQEATQLWVLFTFLCASHISLHWFAWRPKAPGWAGWQSSLTTTASSGHLGSSSFLRCDKQHSWEALAGFQLCSACTEGKGRDSSNTPREHVFITLWFSAVIFINSKFSHLSKKWMDWTVQNLPSTHSNTYSSFQFIYLSPALRLNESRH